MDPERFEWDAHNIGHIGEHGVGVNEAEAVFADRWALHYGRRFMHGEWRSEIVGETEVGRILRIVYTTAGQRLRVITAYTASRRYQRAYLHGKGQS